MVTIENLTEFTRLVHDRASCCLSHLQSGWDFKGISELEDIPVEQCLVASLGQELSFDEQIKLGVASWFGYETYDELRKTLRHVDGLMAPSSKFSDFASMVMSFSCLNAFRGLPKRFFEEMFKEIRGWYCLPQYVDAGQVFQNTILHESRNVSGVYRLSFECPKTNLWVTRYITRLVEVERDSVFPSKLSGIIDAKVGTGFVRLAVINNSLCYAESAENSSNRLWFSCGSDVLQKLRKICE